MKCTWEILLRNTVGKYNCEIQLRNTIENYNCEIQLRNTADWGAWNKKICIIQCNVALLPTLEMSTSWDWIQISNWFETQYYGSWLPPINTFNSQLDGLIPKSHRRALKSHSYKSFNTEVENIFFLWFFGFTFTRMHRMRQLRPIFMFHEK